MKLYQFMPDELTEAGTRIMGNVVAQMVKDGDLDAEAAEKWMRRAVLVQEPSFTQRLFGKIFKDVDDGLRIVIVERVTEGNAEDEDG